MEDLKRGREVGREVMDDIVRPEIRGRARVKAERAVGTGRERRRVVCML